MTPLSKLLTTYHMVNKLDLIGKDTSKMEIIAIIDTIQPNKNITNKKLGKGAFHLSQTNKSLDKDIQFNLQFEIGEIERAIYAKLVQKVGNRHHWEDWANDIAKIAHTHIDRISGILENPANSRERVAFQAFAHELRDNINDSISDGDIIEMLAQHLITKPVFDALFEGYSFAQHNPMSLAMQGILDILHEHHLEKETDTLQSFYNSVKMRAMGIDSAVAKQKIVVELYDKFFSNAFPRMTERLGIVYTPVEVVDFIIHSVNHLLQTEFNKTLGSAGVHIIDPFTGTGTFITRLLQSGLITKEQLPHKYQNEIHANEIVLLAYYIAAINIESTYHELVGGEYQPFRGICLTDTFQLHEKNDLVSALLVDNSDRRIRQKALDIRVIMGNPPYSAGQTSANDNNQNVAYPHLDQRIRDTYAARSTATLKNALYDSYIRAIRWASDRIGDSGVIGFVSGSGFLEKQTMDGLRKFLAEEFSSIHVINLRGDIRKNMLSKGLSKEGQNIFGSGSMTGIAITLFVKNPDAQHGQIYFHDIGDDLTREDKLEKISTCVNVAGVDWRSIAPDQHGDWLNQRDDGFGEFIVMGDKKGGKDVKTIFENYSNGVKTNRDAWCYNASKLGVAANMRRMIGFYNQEVERFAKAKNATVDDFVDTDPTKISWDHVQKLGVRNKRFGVYTDTALQKSIYRPFSKIWLYFDKFFNNRVSQIPRIFPDATAENRVITMTAKGSRNGFTCLISNVIVDLNSMEAGAQCFPLYLYDEPATTSPASDLFSIAKPTRTRRDAITDAGLAHFQSAYPSEKISKEDIFYYVYGLLYAPGYREKYADNLSKELPRIPCVPNFWGFSKAGRELAELHINYETVAMYPAKITGDDDEDYRVEKMRYGKNGKEKDLSTIHYNDKITITGIPLAAYEYVVNGKPAIDWVMERQCVKTDKDSRIVNDANDWAVETMHNPRYPLELLLRVVTVSIETMKIIKVMLAF